MSEPLLRIRSLEVDYGRVQALRGVDLDVATGGVVALIGANGAGKTTLLRSISGLVPARAGSIRFEGRDILGQAPSRIARAGLAHAPEGRRIFSRMTVADNLRAGGYQVNATVARRRASAIYDRFPRLAERRGQPAGLLSGGEQQMLAIGRALMSDPRLLLLDEPSMGLAPLLIEAIFAIIADLRREGKTILLVEQNARAALTVADNAYVLESGRVALSGPAAEVAQDPRVTAAYLGG